MAILNNLYPPIVETYMPAFKTGDKCKVYFALSTYNDLKDIKYVHITARDQKTNFSMLNPSRYPAEVMVLDKSAIKVDNEIGSKYKYYIEIEDADIRGNAFTIDEYYKIQIRFAGNATTNVSLSFPQAIDAWLTLNLNNFSEWSTVCLVRSIPKPKLDIQGFSLTENNELVWALEKTQLVGALSFVDKNDESILVPTIETLRSYQVIIKDADTDKILSNSGDLFTNSSIDPNGFVYNFQYVFSTSVNYILQIKYTTSNLYTETNEYNFTVEPFSDLSLDVVLTGRKDPENGRMSIRVQKTNLEQTFTGKIVIRRASSKDSFTFWEDICIKEFNNAKSIDFQWYDYLIESGIWYDYAVQGVDEQGLRGQMIHFIEPSMVTFEHMYLTNPNKQLKIEFNPTISSFKKNYKESKLEPLGSKYPFIRRNGATEYAQFPISGLISSAMDEQELFTSKEEIYGTSKDFYEKYNKTYGVDSLNDVVFEKLFRDKVLDFLYKDEVKVFKSATEGTFLVRLMDVSITPNTTLGRRLWTFSATAYQVDDFTIENCSKYGFSTGGE